jgi:hypothetical protein
MSRHVKRLLNKSKRPVTHIARRTTSVYGLIFAVLFAGVGTYLIVGSFAATQSCTSNVTTLTGSAIQTAVTNAAAGSTICLAAGTYSGSLAVNGVNKSSDVIVTTASGQRDATIDITINNSSHIKFQNLTISGFGIAGSSAKNISVLNNTFVGQMSIDTFGNTNAGILIDGNTFDGISACANCQEGRITVGQYPAGTAPVGVTISHNHFGGAGQSDGIQDGAYGVVIKDNVFDGILQVNGYTRHVDSLQLYGQSHTTVTGNYFANFTTAIMAPDGGDTETIDNNVFISPTDGGSAIQLGHHSYTTFRHNVVKGTDVHSWVGAGDSDPNNHVVMQDNVMINASFVAHDCVSCTTYHNLYNLSGEASGTSSIIGTPIFTGGASPTNHDGYILASNSPGYNNASDGTSRGVFAGGVTDIKQLNGLLGADTSYFPISVWLQTPSNTVTINGQTMTVGQAYANAGIDIINNGGYPATNGFMQAIQNAGQTVIEGDQSSGLASTYKGLIKAWGQDDEVDNAQSNGSGGYDPCIDPNIIISKYNSGGSDEASYHQFWPRRCLHNLDWAW